MECNRCKTRGEPDPATAGYADLKLEAAPKCRSCRKGRWVPGVHTIKLTESREIHVLQVGESG